MEPLEIEVKYFLENIESVREQLIKTGAESHGRFFESNICFDNFRRVKMDMKTFFPLFEAGGINTISEIRH